MKAIEARQNFRENLALALDTLRTHKFRSLLTVLGVLIGTTTIIGVASIIAGLDRQVSDIATDFGTRSLWIYKFDPGFKFRLTREERMRKPLSYEDAMALRDLCPSIDAVGVELANFWAPPTAVKYKGQEMLDTQLSGASPGVFELNNATIVDGRFYTDIDNLHRSNVAVIGTEIVKRLFEHEDPMGKSLIVDGHLFEIIGTLGKRKEFLGDTGNDRIVYIPYLTYKKLYPNFKEHFISARVAKGKSTEQAMDEVTGVLRRRRHVKPSEPDNFGMTSAEALVAQFRRITGTVALVMVVLSSIGLLVGGIGVMNIMLVSVTERTREIGVRKAIGARRSDITWQFLLEAMTLTGAGGVMGIVVGFLLSLTIRTLVPSLPSTVPLWSVVIGFVASISIGLFFGMWPALKAARLDPIVALRYE